jgi:chemotaxis signal transduction protein
MLAAEIIGLIVVNVIARRMVGLHVHPADRISHVDSSSMSATITL